MTPLISVLLAIATTLFGLAVLVHKGDLIKNAPAWAVPAIFTVSVLLYIQAAILAILNVRRERRNSASGMSDAGKLGGDIQGTVKRGYLDLRTFPASNTGGWASLTHGCSVKFYVEAVNHNDQATWFRPEETKLELSIGEGCFHGTWEHIESGELAVNDDRITDKRLTDLFDGFKPLQQGVPWNGYVGFFIWNFNRHLLDDRTAITGNIKILIHDTLGKVHSVRGNNIKILVGRLCLVSELGNQNPN